MNYWKLVLKAILLGMIAGFLWLLGMVAQYSASVPREPSKPYQKWDMSSLIPEGHTAETLCGDQHFRFAFLAQAGWYSLQVKRIDEYARKAMRRKKTLEQGFVRHIIKTKGDLNDFMLITSLEEIICENEALNNAFTESKIATFTGRRKIIRNKLAPWDLRLNNILVQLENEGSVHSLASQKINDAGPKNPYRFLYSKTASYGASAVEAHKAYLEQIGGMPKEPDAAQKNILTEIYVRSLEDTVTRWKRQGVSKPYDMAVAMEELYGVPSTISNAMFLLDVSGCGARLLEAPEDKVLGQYFEDYYSAEDAQREMLAALGILHKDIKGCINEMFAHGRVRIGNRNVAYPFPIGAKNNAIGIPFIQIRFAGAYADLISLTHEMGHAIHILTAKETVNFHDDFFKDNPLSESFAHLMEGVMLQHLIHEELQGLSRHDLLQTESYFDWTDNLTLLVKARLSATLIKDLPSRQIPYSTEEVDTLYRQYWREMYGVSANAYAHYWVEQLSYAYGTGEELAYPLAQLVKRAFIQKFFHADHAAREKIGEALLQIMQTDYQYRWGDAMRRLGLEIDEPEFVQNTFLKDCTLREH